MNRRRPPSRIPRETRSLYRSARGARPKAAGLAIAVEARLESRKMLAEELEAYSAEPVKPQTTSAP
jgi:hypothetical protein